MGTGCGRRSRATTWIDSGWSTSKRCTSSRAIREPLPRSAVADLQGRVVAFLEGRRSAELLAELTAVDLRGKSIAVQLYGAPNPELSQALCERGATVIELAPYVWDRPIDPAPVQRLLEELAARRVDVLLITSQVQVEH